MATRFRPCIDLRGGRVVQIVGGTLTDHGGGVQTNFQSDLPAEHYAQMYRNDRLDGGHVIALGPGNEAAARAALAAWPGGLQYGGGVDATNAVGWIDAGASAVIVTSWLFPDGVFSPERLVELKRAVGREHIVIDLSCRRVGNGWMVATERWQRVTKFAVDTSTLGRLAASCREFLIHAADVEGLCRGIDEELVTALGRWSPIPVVYAGGARTAADLGIVEKLSAGRVDLTIGSALDIFGGTGAAYTDCVAWNRAHGG